MKSHPRLVSALAFVWLGLYTRLICAAVVLSPFAQDVRGFDFESLIAAAGAGLLGGAGRTIYSLASEKIVVGSLWREGIKDAALALMGGVVAWAIVSYLANYWASVLTHEARMLVIVAAGASRGRWANIIGDFFSAGLGALKMRFVAFARGEAAPVSDAPPSVVSPLNETK